MIDDLSPARPQSGPAQRRHRVARPGRGRHPALHGHLPDAGCRSRSGRSAARAPTTSRGRPSGRRIYAHAGGSPQALATLRSKGRGQYVYNAEYFRFGRAYFHRLRSRPLARTTCTPTATTLRQLGKGPRREGRRRRAVRRFLPDAPEVSRPVRRPDPASTYRANTVTYRYARSTNTYRRSVSVEGTQVDAGRRRARSSRRTSSSWSSASPRPATASIDSRPT